MLWQYKSSVKTLSGNTATNLAGWKMWFMHFISCEDLQPPGSLKEEILAMSDGNMVNLCKKM